jgi:hypothetical protein
VSGPQLSIEVSWFWDWVPAAGAGAAERAAWSGYVTSLLDTWVGEKVAAARAAWPADAAEEFPFTPGEMGPKVARDLLARTEGLPANCRLVWGAGFLGETVRWLPVLIVAEFREPRPGDSSYLMAVVGAEGLDGDVREPKIDYVTTGHGDGIRVIAMADSEGEGLHGRVNAALRLEGPPVDVDVLLTTRVAALDQLAVIGPGIEALMHMIADQFGAQPGDGVPPLRFSTAAVTTPAGPEAS